MAARVVEVRALREIAVEEELLYAHAEAEWARWPTWTNVKAGIPLTKGQQWVLRQEVERAAVRLSLSAGVIPKFYALLLSKHGWREY